MFNPYLTQEIQRLEHEERMRSATPIPDFFEPITTSQPVWISRQVRRLLFVLAKRALTKRAVRRFGIALSDVIGEPSVETGGET
jgi:hypothetical protein